VCNQSVGSLSAASTAVSGKRKKLADHVEKQLAEDIEEAGGIAL